MALIKCPECGGQVSSTAKLCPHCGFAVKDHLAEQNEANDELTVARQLLARGGCAVIRFPCIPGFIYQGEYEYYLQYAVYLINGKKRSLFGSKDDLKQLRLLSADGSSVPAVYSKNCTPTQNALYAIELDGPSEIEITEKYLYVDGRTRFRVEPGHAYRIRNVSDPKTKLHWHMELEMFI